jgi:hypothetical protein
MDFRPTQQVTGNGRMLILKDRTIAGQVWFIREGLTTPEDINTYRRSTARLASPQLALILDHPRAHQRPTVKVPKGRAQRACP